MRKAYNPLIKLCKTYIPVTLLVRTVESMKRMHIWDDECEKDFASRYKCHGHYDDDAIVCMGCEYDDVCWKLKKMCGEVEEVQK